MNRNSKKMLKLAVSIGMIVLGVYMTFFGMSARTR